MARLRIDPVIQPDLIRNFTSVAKSFPALSYHSAGTALEFIRMF